MEFSRRETLALGAGAAALSMLPLRGFAATADEMIAETFASAPETEILAIETLALETETGV